MLFFLQIDYNRGAGFEYVLNDSSRIWRHAMICLYQKLFALRAWSEEALLVRKADICIIA